jgi:hypothetical protein
MIAIPPEDLFADLAEENPEALLADGFEDALIGYTCNHHHPVVAVYDLNACVQKLMEDGLSEDEAVEYLSFNTLGAYVGQDGPLFVRTKHGP